MVRWQMMSDSREKQCSCWYTPTLRRHKSKAYTQAWACLVTTTFCIYEFASVFSNIDGNVLKHRWFYNPYQTYHETLSHKKRKTFIIWIAIWTARPLNYPPGGSAVIYCTLFCSLPLQQKFIRSERSKLAHISPRQASSHTALMKWVTLVCLALKRSAVFLLHTQMSSCHVCRGVSPQGVQAELRSLQYGCHTSHQNTSRTV